MSTDKIYYEIGKLKKGTLIKFDGFEPVYKIVKSGFGTGKHVPVEFENSKQYTGTFSANKKCVVEVVSEINLNKKKRPSKKLIAAAPEMLEVLQLVNKEFEQLPCKLSTWERVQYIIDKATK